MPDQLPLLDLPATDARRPAGRRGHCLAVVPDRPEIVVEIPGADWHLDQHTRDVGFVGVAAARRALAEAVGRSAA